MKVIVRHIVPLLIMMILSFNTSCTIESYVTKKNAADEEIQLYINNNDINLKPNSSGLVFIPIKKGNGIYPKDGDKVAFHYTGYYLNGDVFDTSYDKSYPLVIELGNNMIIKGLEETLMLMDKGSKAKVIIPFYLAYNDMEDAPVPPYSNLIFEVELIDFTSSNK